MKKSIIIIILFILAVSAGSFAQEQKKQDKEQIKPALLVIDIQNFYLQMVPEKDKGISLYYINELINLFQKNGFPIIKIHHFDKENGPKQDSEMFQFPKSVTVAPGEIKVIKTYGDGFNKTDLDKVLKENGCNTLFLCGLSAVGCVLSTWIGAQNHDYKAFMIKDAIMSHNSEYTDNVEKMFDAVGYEMVKLIVENSH